MNELCYFHTNGYCKTIADRQCDGAAVDCHFYQTEEQFIANRDRAVIINRRKGNCEKCRYVKNICMLSTENPFSDSFGGVG